MRYPARYAERSAGIRAYAAEHDWLTIVCLPAYSPDLNPVEGIWSLLRRAVTANVVFSDRDQLVQTVRRGMRRIQRAPHLIDGECGLASWARVMRLRPA
ncbi:transposase [Streptomyces netropsis]